MSVPLWLLWDFTVDDALVSARVAHHLAIGVGYRFNASGPLADAVTPLGFAPLLALFAGPGTLAAFRAAKCIGALALLASAALLGTWVARLGRHWSRYPPLGVLGCSAPLAAWAASGMETGLVTLLATLALARSRWASLAAGLAAAWRPELIPWAAVIAVGTSLARRAGAGAIFTALALSVGPACGVGVVRACVFGHVAPLSVLAKPSDLEHGLRYAVGALLGTAVLPLGAAWAGYRRLGGHYRAIAVAITAHTAALVLAGGDWMALYRLMVPVLPGAVLLSAALAEVSHPGAALARTGSALVLSLALFATTGVRGMHVGGHRLDLIRGAGGPLGSSRQVAALDVGWVGAATRADITDLAGITDRSIARLPGGHTSKRIPLSIIEQRDVDTLVLLLAPGAQLSQPWWTSRFDRRVEQRLAGLVQDLGFRPQAQLALGGTEQRYLVLRRKVPGAN